MVLGQLRTLTTGLHAFEFFFFLVKHRCDLRANNWQAFLDVIDDDHVQGPAEVSGAHPGGKRCIRAVCLEESIFSLKSFLDRFASKNVLLRPTDHTYVAELQRVDFALDYLDAVSAIVHYVNFRYDSDSSLTERVNFARELECVRVGKVLVGSSDSHDDRCLRLHVLVAELHDLLVDVHGLVAGRYLGHAWQVYKGQVDYMPREDFADQR